MKRQHIIIVLDQSGSMDLVKDDTIGGFNAFIERQKEDVKKDPADVRVSLTLFNTQAEVRYADYPLAAVRSLTADTYRPNGYTALYDAIGNAIRSVEERVNLEDQVVMVIFTDGLENSSKEYTLTGIKTAIEIKQRKGNWTFVYLGADQDAWAASQGMGFKFSNVMNYKSVDTHETLVFAAAAVSNYRSSDAHQTDNLFEFADEARSLQQERDLQNS